jgi:hypothetical protein
MATIRRVGLHPVNHKSEASMRLAPGAERTSAMPATGIVDRDGNLQSNETICAVVNRVIKDGRGAFDRNSACIFVAGMFPGATGLNILAAYHEAGNEVTR